MTATSGIRGTGGPARASGQLDATQVAEQAKLGLNVPQPEPVDTTPAFSEDPTVDFSDLDDERRAILSDALGFYKIGLESQVAHFTQPASLMNPSTTERDTKLQAYKLTLKRVGALLTQLTPPQQKA